MALFFIGNYFPRSFLRTLRRCYKFSRNLHDAFLWDGRSIYKNIDILGVNYFPKKFWDSSFAYFLEWPQYSDYFLGIIFQELEWLFIL